MLPQWHVQELEPSVLKLDAPDLRVERILLEDDDVLAVDKPAGVACLPGGGSEDGADLRARAERHLAARDGLDVDRLRLKAPETIDRDVSGVVLFARTAEASSALGCAGEAGSIERAWIAVVTGVPPARRELAAPPHKKRGRGAGRIAIQTLARGQRTALVEVQVLEGRPGQIRAALARAGLVVVGDVEHGAEEAARLHLASHRVSFPHPRTGARFAVDAPVPVAMRAALEGPGTLDRHGLRALLRDAIDARHDLLGRATAARPTTAFRLLNATGDGVPGVAVDVYGDHLVVHFYADELTSREDDVLDALAELEPAGIYVKRRPKQANELVDTRTDHLAPPRAVRGADAPEPVVVLEDGVPFRARLGDGLSTGIFLDQRENRRRVHDWSDDAEVLNLFAYEGAFTVAAAAGSAKRTVSVDVSRAALEALARNLEDAGHAGPAHTTVKGDALEVLERLHAHGERFDLVIADPPTYSTTKRARWTSGRDWERLALACFLVLRPGGRLLACSNDRRLGSEALRAHLEAGARAAGIALAAVRSYRPPVDFPKPSGAGPRLETVVVELRG